MPNSAAARAVNRRQAVSFDFPVAPSASDVTVYQEAVKKLGDAGEAQSQV